MTVFLTIIYVFIYTENPSLDKEIRPYFIDHSDDTTKYRVPPSSISIHLHTEKHIWTMLGQWTSRMIGNTKWNKCFEIEMTMIRNVCFEIMFSSSGIFC